MEATRAAQRLKSSGDARLIHVPADHLRVVVDGDVGSPAVVVGPKMAIGCTKPFVEAILQGEVLRSVAQMPVVK